MVILTALALVILILMSQELRPGYRICLCSQCFVENRDLDPQFLPVITRKTVDTHIKKYRLGPVTQGPIAENGRSLVRRPDVPLGRLVASPAAPLLPGVLMDMEPQVPVEEMEESVGADEVDAEEEEGQAYGKLPGKDGSVDVRSRLRTRGTTELRDHFAAAVPAAVKFYLTVLALKIKYDQSTAAVNAQLQNVQDSYSPAEWGRSPKNFDELLIFAEVHGWIFVSKYVYDVCRKCYYIFRGPEEVEERAEHCRRCNTPRARCMKFDYRFVFHFSLVVYCIDVKTPLQVPMDHEF